MRHPFIFSFFLFGILSAAAQTDTIFITEKILLPCKIIKVSTEIIQYSDAKDPQASIDLNQVKYYSVNGVRIAGSYKSLQPKIKTDTQLVFNNDLEHVKYSLRRGHQQYVNGLVTATFGTAITVAGAFMTTQEVNGSGAIVGFGSIMTFIGLVTMIDSHKWQKKAGLGVKAKSTGVAVSYRFK